MTTAVAPSSQSPKEIPPSSPPTVSTPVDSLQPVAASPQISRTSSSSIQGSPGTTLFSSSLLSTSPSQSRRSPSPSQSFRHPVPSFPPPQPSRLSTASASFALSHRDSFHPQFPSSLSYTSVRDFAYPNLHPLHYGPPKVEPPAPESHRNSPSFDSGGGGWYSGSIHGHAGRRLSDPSFNSHDNGGGWGGSWMGEEPSGGRGVAGGRGPQPPPLRFEDGPPWNEDPDLHSPVVVNQSSRHRKHKSSGAHLQSSQGYSRRPSKNAVDYQEPAEGSWARGDGNAGNEEYFSTGGRSNIGEPGGEFYNQEYYDGDYGDFPPTNGAFLPKINNPDYYDDIDEEEEAYSEEDGEEGSRLSRRYHFTIASAAEEMHGKAVALFDFQKENENELGLVEGQVIWVSYRHGMGWLVAEDPKTRESGLVPEEYVRLLRDIRQPLFGHDGDELPTEEDISAENTSGTFNGAMKPVVSTFSTSSQDIHPYPLPLHHGDAPPRTLSRGGLGSQVQTPTVGSWEERVEALEREREMALIEEERAGFGGKGVSGGMEDTPRVGAKGWGTAEDKDGLSGEEDYHRQVEKKEGLGLGLLGERMEDVQPTELPNTKVNGTSAGQDMSVNGGKAEPRPMDPEAPQPVLDKGKAIEREENPSKQPTTTAALVTTNNPLVDSR